MALPLLALGIGINELGNNGLGSDIWVRASENLERVSQNIGHGAVIATGNLVHSNIRNGFEKASLNIQYGTAVSSENIVSAAANIVQHLTHTARSSSANIDSE